MTSTTHAAAPHEVDDLAGAELRDAVSSEARAALISARDRYALAYQWCLVHPPMDPDDAAVLGDSGLPGLGECDLRVGGAGTPGVARLAAEEYAALAGVSVAAGIQVLSDTLDLHHRFPRLQARVDQLEIPAWTAARIASETSHLSLAAATWIDRRLAETGRHGWRSVQATIQQAIATFHPDLLRSGVLGKDDWDVTVDHSDNQDGTSRLNAIGDSVDLAKFHDLVCDEADRLRRLGNADSLGQRKARALGALADRQATLDLTTTASPAASPDHEGGITRRRSYLRPKVFIHLTLAQLAAHRSDGTDGIADAGLLGPQLVSQIEEWLRSCGSDARITPVLDLHRDWAVDQHDPPEAMREQVILRDEHCVFPHCTRDARGCDLDHVQPYDPNGPPGQTRPDGLAPLCRGHHLLKTFTAWTYQRTEHGTYTWTSPHRERWRVRPGRGTTRINQ